MAESQSSVTYRDIPDFPGYRVGDDGSVWSCRALNCHGPVVKWRRLKPAIRNGYYRVAFKCEGRKGNSWRFVHRLVLEAFIGPRPEGTQACHNDGDKSNNVPGNLRWGTPKENTADSFAQGRILRGDQHGSSKLTEADVRRIRALAAEGKSRMAIGRMFGVSDRTVYDILIGRTWRHVDLALPGAG